MHYLYLPYLTGDDTIEFALEKMREGDARAIVVERALSECTLYMNHQVLEAWSDQRTYCKELLEYEGERVVRLHYWEVGAAEETGLNLEGVLERELDRHRALFALLFPETSPFHVTLVITRHEGVANGVRGARVVCRCTGVNHHRGQSPPKDDGQECDYCYGMYVCR